MLVSNTLIVLKFDVMSAMNLDYKIKFPFNGRKASGMQILRPAGILRKIR